MIAKLRTKLHKAQIDLASLRAEPSRQQQSGGISNMATEYDEEIKLLGRKFGIMEEPWIDRALFKRPRPVMAATSSKRYGLQLAIQQGIVADLYNFVPEKLHAMMNGYNPFAKKVH